MEKMLKDYKKFNIKNKEVLETIKGNFLHIIKSKYTLNNDEVLIREELIKNNGNSDAVIVMAVTTDNKVLLTIQPRVITKKVIAYELPAGYIDQNEKPIEAAIRELKEETGYIAKEHISLGSYYQDPGCSNTINHCFLFKGCTKVKEQSLDHDEFIEVEEVTIKELLEMVNTNIIDDAGSLITILKGERLI